MSATGFLDACGFFPAAGGTADLVVSAAITGYQTPSSAGAVNGAVYSYRAQSSDLSQWEIGFGTYTTGTTTLARTTVVASSTGSKVNFSAPPSVYITALTADLLNASLLASGTVPTARLPLGTGANQVPQLDAAGKLLNAVMGASWLGPAGYYTLPGGLIIQWGALTTVTGNDAVSFPVSFPTVCLIVLASRESSTTPSNSAAVVVTSTVNTTVSGTTVSTRTVSAGSVTAAAAGFVFNYIAIGY